MNFVPVQSVGPTSNAPAAAFAGAKRIYNALLGEHGVGVGAIDEVTRSASRSFLATALGHTASIDSDIPDDPRSLADWLALGHRHTAAAYRHYLDGRHAGEPRRLFRNRAHALHFIQSVAPTKLVDGAWLYGLLPHWRDSRLSPLIRIYLEELGDGVAEQHHVLLYRKLLSVHGVERWRELGDGYHVQGAIQLSLARHAAELLPEVIGFNLGYEQLPLHLPITAYELNELGIDPYYFSLHVTIDNASTGHARKSLQCALECLPVAGGSADFYRRMVAGFKLNDLGIGTMDAIASFDLDRELVGVLADKGRIGAQLHSDYCRIGGRTVAEWLTTAGGMPGFLNALVAAGWIRRGAPLQESRFWRLLDDERAPMFGVFDEYEKQLIEDWITDAPAFGDTGDEATAVRRPLVNRFRRAAAAGRQAASGNVGAQQMQTLGVAEVVGRQLASLSTVERVDDDVRRVGELLTGVDEPGAAIDVLQGFLSPANHCAPAGLLATRICSQLIGR